MQKKPCTEWNKIHDELKIKDCYNYYSDYDDWCNMNDYYLEAIDIEEKLIENKNKKQRKHYLNPNAKAFINKFIRMVKGK